MVIMTQEDGLFYSIFEFPTKAQSGGEPSGSEKYYSVDNGNVHLVMIDSEMQRTDVIVT